MKKYIFIYILLCLLSSCSSFIHTGSMNRFYLKKKNFSWKSFSAKDFIVYYQSNSLAEKNLPLVETKIAAGIHKAKEITKIDSLKIPIYYFIVDDKKEFNQLTRLNHTGVSYSRSNTIVESYPLLGQAHEVVHLISYQNWGNSHTWIMEGFSVYSDDSWGGKSLKKIGLELEQNNKLIPLEKLLKNSKFSHWNPQISYPQSGSLIKYLISTYGWEQFLQFWKKPNIQKIYNITKSDLENNWKHSLFNE